MKEKLKTAITVVKENSKAKLTTVKENGKAKLTTIKNESKVVKKSTDFYFQYQKYLPLMSFCAGFSFDTLTLTRIDKTLSHITLLSYLVIIYGMVILSNLVEHRLIQHPFTDKHCKWFPSIIQFCVGALFSAYVVFYFQSASLSKSILFVVLLFVLMVANEFFNDSPDNNLHLQMATLFLVTFSYLAFTIPILAKVVNDKTFYGAAGITVLLLSGLIVLFYRLSIYPGKKQMLIGFSIISSLLVLMSTLYATNMIPPVPLSMKAGGIYHDVRRVKGQYELKYQKPKWYQFFRSWDEVFYYHDRDTVYCFSSVFAPTDLTADVYHQWQRFDEKKQKWKQTDRIKLNIRGGRDDGWRGYTRKKNIVLGKWRVNVLTDNDQLLGRISFKIQKPEEGAVEFKVAYK